MGDFMPYDFDDLRKHAPAERVAELLGVKVSGGRSAAEWRNGQKQNVAYYEDGTFKDFAAKGGAPEHGDGVELYMYARGVSRAEANEFLGDYFCPGLRRQKGQAKSKERKAAPERPAPAPLPLPEYPGDLPTVEPSEKVAQPLPFPVAVASSEPAFALPFQPVSAASNNRFDRLVADGYTKTAEWLYKDRYDDSVVLLRVIRMDKPGKGKEMLQCSGNDSWKVQTDTSKLLYHAYQVDRARKVYIVEGEKCADVLNDRLAGREGCVATTNPGGAKNWNDGVNERFFNRDVVILTDNDDVGRNRGEQLASKIARYARTVKVLCPSDKPKGDVADFFDGGEKTIEDFDKLEDDAPFYRTGMSGIVTPEMKKKAKKLNETHFTNYTIYINEQNKAVASPKSMDEIIKETEERFLGFPKSLNGTLFDRDQDTKKLFYIRDANQFGAWMKKFAVVDFKTTDSRFVSIGDLFQNLCMSKLGYSTISRSYTYPMPNDVFYDCDPIPASSETTNYLSLFLSFFSPVDDASKMLLKAMVVSLAWMPPEYVARPCWVIDSADGPGVGKTTLVHEVCALFNMVPITFHQNDLEMNENNVKGRILSETGLASRAVLMDNVSGYLESNNLADMITAPTISGRPPYGKGETVRKNDLTYFITSNSAQFSTDMAVRSYPIVLKKAPVNLNSWTKALHDFVGTYRYEIQADIIRLLDMHRGGAFVPRTRFQDFEREIVQKVVRDEIQYKAVMDFVDDFVEKSNVEKDKVSEVIDCFKSSLSDLFPDYDSRYIFVSNAAVRFIGKRMDIKLSSPKMLEWAKSGSAPNISKGMTLFPFSGTDRTRGIMYMGEKAEGRLPVVFVNYKDGRLFVQYTGRSGETYYYER